MNTESALRDWRYGPTQAERLCAGILHLEGYADVDPQAPLGGSDNKKDVLCRKDGRAWVAAVYFPSTGKDFSEIRSKFASDLPGVGRNGADGFVFFVNQHLTLGERITLQEMGASVPVEIYHLERLRNALDVPTGYGLRREYLRIEMTDEEKVSWLALDQDARASGIGEYQRALGERHRQLREAVLELDLRTMADLYAFRSVAQLERYETGRDEFPPEALAVLRETFFVSDDYLRGTSRAMFESLTFEQSERIHSLLDSGFDLYFLCAGDRRDLLAYPYLHRADGEISSGVIAHRLSSFAPAATGGAINLFQVINLMLDRGMDWTDAAPLTVTDSDWERLRFRCFHMSKYGPATHWGDRECQDRLRQMFDEARAVREELPHLR